MAATPQEGWFIAGIENVDGIDYYVIDNKMSMDPWFVQCASQTIALDFSAVDLPNDSQATLNGYYRDVLLSQLYYRGFSDYSWRIDNDWIVKIWAEDTDARFPYQVIIYDRTQLPSVAYNHGYVYDGSYMDSPFSSEWTLQQTTPACIPFKYDDNYGALFSVSRNNTGKWTYWEVGVFQMYSIFGLPTRIAGSDINDICVSICYGRGRGNSSWVGTDASSLIQKKIALQWLCPVDKAPAGMSVGDYWPKVRPLEVEIEEAMNAYEEAMLQNGQIRDPSDINSMFGQLGGMQEQGLGALEIGDAEAGFFTAAVSMMQPLFLTLLPIIGVGVILIIFANKGMHG